MTQLDITRLDERALRLVAEAAVHPKEGWSPLDVVRFELVKAGVLSVGAGVAAYAGDPREHWRLTPYFFDWLIDEIGGWDNAPEAADALCVVLSGVISMQEAGFSLYGDTYTRCLGGLEQCCSQMEPEELAAFGSQFAEPLLGAAAWFWIPGEPGEFTGVLEALGDAGRECLCATLEAVCSTEAPARPAARAAQSGWRADVLDHEHTVELAEGLLELVGELPYS